MTEPPTRNPHGLHETYRQASIRCGKPRCRCRNGGPLHGPYWYAYWTDPGGATRSRYVGKSLDAKLVAQQSEPWDRRGRPDAAKTPAVPTLAESNARAIVVATPAALSTKPAPSPRPATPVTPATGAVYLLMIRLWDVTPEVWRRLLVPASMTLAALHDVLQIALGWENVHLYQFHVDGMTYGPPDLGGKSSAVRLSDTLPFGATALYVYDMGDCWEHQIHVQDVADLASTHRLRCIDGKGTVPGEDSGGPFAPKRRRRARFNLAAVNEALQRYAERARASVPTSATHAPRSKRSSSAKPVEPPIARPQRKLFLQDVRPSAYGAEYEFSDESHDTVIGVEFRLPWKWGSPYMSVVLLDYGADLGARVEGRAKARGTGRNAHFVDAFEAAVSEWQRGYGDGIDWLLIESRLIERLAFDRREIQRLQRS